MGSMIEPDITLYGTHIKRSTNVTLIYYRNKKIYDQYNYYLATQSLKVVFVTLVLGLMMF